MAPQLRIDRARRVDGKVVLEYSHHLATLPLPAMGYGCVWESTADLREQARALRDSLRQPEQMLLLAVMAALAADSDLTTLALLVGKVLTFDDTSPTTPVVIS